jgi:hypothetical protein
VTFRDSVTRPASLLALHWLSRLGAVLSVSSAFVLVFFWTDELLSGHSVHPYSGIVLTLFLPGLFVLGLLLMPFGVYLHRRSKRRQGLVAAYPRLDLSEPVIRRALTQVGIATILNMGIVGMATYKGVEYLDSSHFCGTTCHNVMRPEYTAFLDSPHARVGCVGCHVGPGASSFIHAKLAGVRQIFAVAFNTFDRPIPSPVHDLRPARETCEQCHWPPKFHGDKFLVRTHFADDEANTPATTVLVLKIGGRTHQGGVGIHGRHFDPEGRVTYFATDERREVIPVVQYRDDQGNVVEYKAKGTELTPAQLARAERRTMDCVDCHNRPSHTFELPERAVDRALDEGRIDRRLPFARKTAVEILRAPYASREDATIKIPAAIDVYYRDRYPNLDKDRKEAVAAAGQAVKAIFLANVFPDMKVTWGSHENHIGHVDYKGCFRCHDELHQTKDGRVISQDCTSCHNLLAMEETDPKVLSDLGLR